MGQINRWSDRKTKVVKSCRVTVNSVLSRMSVNFHSLHGRGKCKIWGLIHISHVKPRSVIHMLKVWYTSTEPRSYSLVHLHWRYKSDHRLICISLRALSFENSKRVFIINNFIIGSTGVVQMELKCQNN